MKIIIHGATNGSNFGDYLFADIFYKKIESVNKDGENMFLEFPKYGFGDFFRKTMNYKKKQRTIDLFNADLLVYISGGYFGQRTSTLKETIIRFIRYMPIGLLFILRRKKIMILGVGGGPISNKFLRKIIVKIINYAQVVTVRDKETAQYFIENGVNKELNVTSDTAQIITKDMLPALDQDVETNLKEIFQGKKIIFLHAIASGNIDNLYAEKIVDSLNNFLSENKDFGVVIGYDIQSSKPIADLEISKRLRSESVYYYDYQNPWQLCSLLNQVDMIITPKLHVGIVGSTLSKSVISFPIHSEKTKRYYKQIGEEGRCETLSNVNPANLEKMIKYYSEKNIILSDQTVALAEENLNLLGNEIIKSK